MTTQTPRVACGGTRRLTLWRVLIYVVLIAFAIFYLMPVYVLIITGLKSFAEVNLYRMWDLPQGFHFDSLRQSLVGQRGQRAFADCRGTF